MSFISKLLGSVFGNKADKDIKKLQPIVAAINEHFESYQNLDNDSLREKTLDFKKRIAAHIAEVEQTITDKRIDAEQCEDLELKENIYDQIDELIKEKDAQLETILEEILPEAFAVVKETARRFTNNDTVTVTATDFDKEKAAFNEYVSVEEDKATWNTSWKAAGAPVTWNMVHYDVQLIGGIMLHKGKIAEMQTGEGKTLVATLPAYLNALAGQGVHVITVNDYLAKRDGEWVGPLFEFLFLDVDCIDNYRPHSEERKKAYRADITYGTNNEFGFDYLRDNMVNSESELVQRKHHYTIIDEIDSVLIDDARTPLIISGPIPKGDNQEYEGLKPIIESLIKAQRGLTTQFLADAKKKIKAGDEGYEEGQGGLDLFRAFRGLPKNRPLTKYLSEEGIKIILQKTENHFMQEQSKNMHIADEALYFVIDEKNNSVQLTDQGVNFLSKYSSDDNFFIMPDLATELDAIEKSEKETAVKVEEKDRLLQDYSVKAKRLHSINQLLKAYTLFEKDDQYIVSNGKVQIIDEQTGRTMDGRRYSDGLHQALEAKENVKIEDATQTYASVTLQNYFRMYHKLSGMTGTAETEASEFWDIYKLEVAIIPTNKPIARKDREDKVYKTEREKYIAVIEEIVQLSEQGRPVLVGTTSVDISEKLSRILTMRGLKHNVLNAKQHQNEASIVAEAGKPGNVTIATNMAGRGTDIKISDEVKALGGLAIIGTERHDSRRVDRQLRGRAGRQGDPGSSQFFVSLEDKLMRLFNSDRIAKLMDSMGFKEGEVIEHSMVTKSIERAQKKVEENNFGSRKRLLEYDDVMNIQREAIYKRRNNALKGERLSVDLYNMFQALTEEIVYLHKTGGDYESFKMDVFLNFGTEPNIDQATFEQSKPEALVPVMEEFVIEYYKNKSDKIKETILPIVKRVFENDGERYKRILIPITDGSERALPISASLEDGVTTEGKSIINDIEKAITLALIDDNWKEHLRALDDLKEAVQAASFEQKDPLVVYKIEAYELFEELVSKMNREVISYLSKSTLAINPAEQVNEAKEEKTDLSKVSTNVREEPSTPNPAPSAPQPAPKAAPVKREGKKIGRNEPCPCGSGKKFKQCHGK